MQRRLFSMILLVVGLCGGAVASAPEAPTIAPAELAARIEAARSPVILDVRTPDEFAQGHVPGARLIPHDRIGEHLDELRGVGEVVMYCRSGRRVEIAAAVLEAAGIAVRRLDGSFLAWQAAQLPVAVPTEVQQ